MSRDPVAFTGLELVAIALVADTAIMFVLGVTLELVHRYRRRGRSY